EDALVEVVVPFDAELVLDRDEERQHRDGVEAEPSDRVGAEVVVAGDDGPLGRLLDEIDETRDDRARLGVAGLRLHRAPPGWAITRPNESFPDEERGSRSM